MALNKSIEDFVDIKDYAKYEYYKELYYKVLEIYDFEKKSFRFLPFDGGFNEQEDKNPKMWQAMNYLIYKILQKRE